MKQIIYPVWFKVWQHKQLNWHNSGVENLWQSKTEPTRAGGGLTPHELGPPGEGLSYSTTTLGSENNPCPESVWDITCDSCLTREMEHLNI